MRTHATIINYKDFHSSILGLNESYFHLPRAVYKDIIDYYIDVYEKVHSKDIKTLSNKNIPPKQFFLDFKNTQFEFLNELKPPPSMIVKIGNKPGRSVYYFIKPNKNLSYVYLNIKDSRRTIYEIIEHEILHFVQDLIHRHNLKIKKIKNSNIGGLPPKKFVPSGVDADGIDIVSPNNKRTLKHSFRPVEYYTNLLSVIRQLQSIYVQCYEKSGYWDKIKDSVAAKKEFFRLFLKAVNDPSVDNFTTIENLTVYIFRDFKEISLEFYKHMLKLAYAGFVNGNINFDSADIERLAAIDLKYKK